MNPLRFLVWVAFVASLVGASITAREGDRDHTALFVVLALLWATVIVLTA